MRQRNLYGLAGTATSRRTQRPVNGPRRAVTRRGQMVLASSRRRSQAR